MVGRLDEKMIESLFGYDPNQKVKNEVTKFSVPASQSRNNAQILDRRKSQNIAILKGFGCDKRGSL